MAEQRDIFLVCNSIDEVGGVQQWAHDLSRLFAARGHRVHLVGIEKAAEFRDYGTDPSYQRTILHDALPKAWRPRGIGHLNVPRRITRSRREAMVDRGAARLSELFRAARPGGVIIVAQVWAQEWVIRADTAGLRVIGMTHESYEASRRTSRYARVKRFYPDVHRLLALTEEDADAWAWNGMSNAGAMPNPVMATPVTRPDLSRPAVVTLRRLAHDKGIDMLVEAWAQVAPQHPDWQLSIYGSGPDEELLRRHARELGLDDRQIFRGLTTDLDAALSSASVYALPSREEGFPIALMEAMAYGLPSVAFDCAPGVRELLEDEVSGLLINPGNVPGFAAALERLIKDPDLRGRLGGQARESVGRFSPEAVVGRWEQLFELLHR
ncbi:MAG TPA: glycosyltransferase family 4 protein [Actinoplanes sp.]|nr:glycosyltransferase family 4 protein [Actinoplanes sp.]